MSKENIFISPFRSGVGSLKLQQSYQNSVPQILSGAFNILKLCEIAFYGIISNWETKAIKSVPGNSTGNRFFTSECGSNLNINIISVVELFKNANGAANVDKWFFYKQHSKDVEKQSDTAKYEDNYLDGKNNGDDCLKFGDGGWGTTLG